MRHRSASAATTALLSNAAATTSERRSMSRRGSRRSPRAARYLSPAGPQRSRPISRGSSTSRAGGRFWRNVAEPVEIFAVVRVDESADHLAIDPVCQMAVDPERAVGRLLLDEKAYYLCSLTCAAAFVQHPDGTPNSCGASCSASAVQGS